MAFLAVAALAIDLVMLYVSQGEAQRAADAAALAGARIIANSGYTSASAYFTASDVCQSGGPGRSALANREAEAVAGQNQVAGQPATVQSINCNLNDAGNPRFSVKVQRTGLPVLFSRIWGSSPSSVSATALAEAYNPSGETLPIQLSVKPWLVPNCDPTNVGTGVNCASGAKTFAYFVDPVTGAIQSNGAFLGQTVLFDKVKASGSVTLNQSPPTTQFYPLDIPTTPPPLCPSTGAVSACSFVGTNSYLDNIACSSQWTQFTCGQTIGPGQSVMVDTAGGLRALTDEGVDCLIHATGRGPNNGQDLFNPNPSGPPFLPATITGGTDNPEPAFQGAASISHSDSVVTVPIYGNSPLQVCNGPNCTPTTVVGFLQLGIQQETTNPSPSGKFQAVILNVAGCGSASGNPNALTGSGFSTIPVRLIHN
ncbi:MAG: hypothetical protein JOY93_11440 [Acidobacteriales bacterium]|nr:hypothetical protein [Terriglobales bacterium]